MPTQSRSFGDRPCPVCGAKMELVQRGKTEIEICDEHGVWLDRGELEAISRAAARFEQARGRALARRSAAQAREDGKVKGWLLGPLAFLFD